ncbi:hypothetical protein F5X99DRAFT_425750 [Biscogniauxia marginata]|nr:hypothetical protein F5X99DRAFT_425750 [Biscogniauxia marginata]
MSSQRPFDLFYPLSSPPATASPFPPFAMSLPSFSLPPARIEALWVAASFIYILANYTFLESVPIFSRRFRFSRNILLLTHIALAIAEVARYHIRAFFLRAPSDSDPGAAKLAAMVAPGALDVLLTVAHSLTVFVLARDRKVGDRALTRPTHQSLAAIRIGLGVAAYAYASPAGDGLRAAFYHRAAVRIMNAFLYPRLLIKLGGALGVLPGYSAVYAASMFLSCLLCLHDAEMRFGPQVFIVVFVGNLLLNRWVAERVVESERNNIQCSPIARLLFRAGFVELKGLRDGREAVARERKEKVAS